MTRPMQRAIFELMKSGGRFPKRDNPHRTISTDTLVKLIRDSNGPKDHTMGAPPTTPALPPLRYASPTEVAIVVGGGGDPLAEFEQAAAMCRAAGLAYTVIVCNDMIASFPYVVDHALTLHPDKMARWVKLRTTSGFPPLTRTWSHRPYQGFSNHSKDWQGSSGLLCVKIMRELGFTHIVLCGVPMTTEGNHFVRKQKWNAAQGFWRGWQRVLDVLRPFVRSYSGETHKAFGAPDIGWLTSIIPDPNPMRGPETGGYKA